MWAVRGSCQGMCERARSGAGGGVLIAGVNAPTAQRKAPPAYKIIAAHPGGCTEAILAAQNIPADVLIGLVSSGLVMARSELLDDVGAVVATTLWITAAGEWVLAAQG
jgi:hypothetical protein